MHARAEDDRYVGCCLLKKTRQILLRKGEHHCFMLCICMIPQALAVGIDIADIAMV